MLRNLLVGLGLILGLTLGAPVVEAAPITLTVVTACGTPPTTYTVGQAFPGTQDTTGKLCSSESGGGGGGTSSTFGAAFPATGTAAGYNDGTNMQGARVFDGDSGAGTEYDVGTLLRVPASGGSAAAAFGNGTAGTTSLRVTVASDSTGVLGVTQSTSPWVVTGAGGSFPITGATSNASSGVATSSTNVPAVSYNYGFNGTTWDQLQVDSSKFLNVDSTGNVANAAADSGNPVKIGGIYKNPVTPVTDGQRVNLLLTSYGSMIAGTTQTGADGVANTLTSLNTASTGSTGADPLIVAPIGYNGTTWDRLRTGDVNNATAVTGFLDDIPTARYNATLPTLTDTRYNSLQVGLRGSLHMELWGSDSTTAIGNFTAGADGSTNTKSGLFVYNYPFLYNGTTWDRAPGTTNGAYGIIRDAAGNARGANVTAASTSAALTDPALVVSLSPNPDNVCTGKTPISQTTSTDVKTFTNVGYICSIILVSATAQNISVTEGTGTVCATGTSAVIGGTTASMAVGVNGGFSAVSERPWVQLGVSADHLCILQSASGNVSGIITWQDHT